MNRRVHKTKKSLYEFQSAVFNNLPVLALTERWALGFRESKCFFRGPEILIEMNN
jgi:hypothetical protein